MVAPFFASVSQTPLDVTLLRYSQLDHAPASGTVSGGSATGMEKSEPNESIFLWIARYLRYLPTRNLSHYLRSINWVGTINICVVAFAWHSTLSRVTFGIVNMH